MYRILYLLITASLLFTCGHRQELKSKLPESKRFMTSDTGIVGKIFLRIESGDITNQDSVISYLHQAFDISEKAGYTAGLVHSQLLKGDYYLEQNNFQEAINQYTMALQIAEAEDISYLQARCMERLGSVNLTIGNENQALKHYYDALAIFERAGDKENIANVYNILGGNKTANGQFEEAESFFLQAIELNEQTGNKSGILHNHANLAFLYQNTGRDEKAHQIYRSIIPQFRQSGDSANLSVLYHHFALSFQWASQPDSSLIYLHRALKIAIKMNDISFLPTLSGMIGMVHFETNQFDSASFHLDAAVELAKEQNDYFTQMQALKLLLAIDTVLGNYEAAAKKFEKVITLNDSVYNQKLRNNREASELNYENQKKNLLIEFQTLKIASVKKQNLFFIILSSLAMIATVLLINLIVQIKRNNNKEQKLLADQLSINMLQLENVTKAEEISKLMVEKAKNALKIKEQELVSHVMELEQKNEIIRLIKTKLKEAAKSGMVRENELNEIVTSIKVQVNEPNMFNTKFTQLHHDFFDNLKKAHPDLTKSELKFCAYLKLRMSSNQIATMQNVTIEAIRKTRHRLRKKLNLELEDSLDDYITVF